MTNHQEETIPSATPANDNAILLAPPPKRGPGRPPGSKNKPKVKSVSVPSPEAGAGVDVPETLASFLPDVKVPKVAVPPPVIKEGLPNLPEVHLIGRPVGSKNKLPRKRRVPVVQSEEAVQEQI